MRYPFCFVVPAPSFYIYENALLVEDCLVGLCPCSGACSLTGSMIATHGCRALPNYKEGSHLSPLFWPHNINVMTAA